ncbi:Two-component signal transduction system YycFG, regulatory protein YycH [Thalassobacillus cyri]|uniref:Two-component signal transduction system YycFG, regulatory protein YycH n=1 Tax=Thalassobacillus cyri TaxID=571932 RepID=A0A1H3XDA2_9BACI|nr:two-component system activity regulator YycH [Thalassobacillus cyri]SDZ96931.1 Two-component signal transduction system YycFG, regulatory protein YycH [Thalassobacillus cyri]
MNFETLKSIILFILIMLSLFLTVALWNYQPSHDRVEDDLGVNTDVGGLEQKMTDVVQPSNIVFHNIGGDYGFKDPKDEALFYQKMQNWTLYNFQPVESGFPEGQVMSEVVFPTGLPISTLSSIFTVSEEEQEIGLPAGNFKHMLFVLDESTESITEVRFISRDGENVVRAQIQATDAFADLISHHRSLENKQELIKYENKNTRIFIPKNEVTMTDHYISVDPVKVEPLTNALFDDVSRVKKSKRSDDTTSFSDYDSEMRIAEDGNSMKLEKALFGKGAILDDYELITESLAMVNNHKGWTDKYHLFDVTDYQVSYRMIYDGIPVLSPSRLSEITVQYRQEELYRYKRPLIDIVDVYADEEREIVLESGERVIDVLENTTSINQNTIQDISIGYRFIPSNPGKQNVFYTLMPAWYVKHNGKWENINEKLDAVQLSKGADQDAMGSN